MPNGGTGNVTYSALHRAHGRSLHGPCQELPRQGIKDHIEK
jgi:hypothetical protein